MQDVAKPAPAAPAPMPEYPLLGYLDELVEQLRTHVTQALREFDEHAVHQSRVATRKLKAALDLYEPVLSKGRRKPFAGELRKLRRRLGPLRDADVMLGHVAEFGRDGGDDRLAPAAAWASAALTRDRDAARERSRRKASPSKVLSKLGRWWGVRDQFAEARDAVDSLLAESLHLQIDAFAEQADLLIAQQQRRTSPLLPPFAAEAAEATGRKPLDPHALRIAGKALRYTLDMAARQGHDLPKSVGRSFKLMQEHLGLWHDYVVLADRVLTEAVATHLGHFDAPLKDRVLDLSKASLRKATKEIDRFYKLWADRGEAICHGIRAAFPLSENVKPEPSEAKTPAADRHEADVASEVSPAEPAAGQDASAGPSAP